MKALFFISIIFFSPFLLLNTPAFGQAESALPDNNSYELGSSPVPFMIKLFLDRGDKVQERFLTKEYVDAAPRIIEMFKQSVNKHIDEIKQEPVYTIVCVYSYPDNIEINFLSEERLKIVDTISPDHILHGLRIKNAFFVMNFFSYNGGIDSNCFLSLELFSNSFVVKDNLDVKPKYIIKKGSWEVALFDDGDVKITTKSNLTLDDYHKIRDKIDNEMKKAYDAVKRARKDGRFLSIRLDTYWERVTEYDDILHWKVLVLSPVKPQDYDKREKRRPKAEILNPRRR